MNQKGISSIVIILIIVGVLVLAGGVWYWQSQDYETANWKTYRNEKYGFEFKYPENFYITQEGSWGKEGSIDSQFYVDLSEYKIAPEREFAGIRIIIGNFSGDFQKYIEELIKKNVESANDIFGTNDSINNVIKSEIRIDDVTGYKVEGITGFGQYNVYFTKNGKIFSINNGIDDNLFKKILSTFKFIQ